MIVFYGDNFELNITETKITLVEENPLFFNFFVKNYSWPFTKKIDDETSEKLGFIDLPNSGNCDLKFYGDLLIDNDFRKSYLIVSSFKNNTIEGTVYYGESTIDLLETPLKDIPFEVIKTESLTEHAKEVIEESYPKVNYNFPMLIDLGFSASKYEKFEGVFNNFKNGNFITNKMIEEDGKLIPANRNLMVPYPYLMGVLKAGFKSVGMLMQGSFVSDQANNKILMYTDKYLEKFSAELPSSYRLKDLHEVWDNGFVVARSSEIISIKSIGSYDVRLVLNIPSGVDVLMFRVKHNRKTWYKSFSNNIDKKLILNIKNEEDKGSLFIDLKLRKKTLNPNEGIGGIESFNRIDFELTDGVLNEFPDTFSLAEVMPDITFGQLLNKIKNWLNVEVVFSKNIVHLNYIESKFLDLDFEDKTLTEVDSYSRLSNDGKIYKLITSNDSFYVEKKGIQNKVIGVRDEDVVKIDMGLEVMPIRFKDGVFTAYKDDKTNDFKLFLYDGLIGGFPSAISTVFGRNYSLEEVYSLFWRKWLAFRLSSEIYKDEFPVSIYEGFDITKGIYKYGKKMIIKKIRKRRNSEEFWDYFVEAETLG